MHCVEGKADGTHLGITQKDPQVEMFEHMGFLRVFYVLFVIFRILLITFRDVSEYIHVDLIFFVSIIVSVYVGV